MAKTTFGKSWLLYLGPSACLILFVCIFSFLVLNSNEVKAYTGFHGSPGVNAETMFFIMPYIIAASLCLLVAWRIALLRSVKLSVHNDYVSFVSGILPWSKEEQHWAPHHIFNARYQYRGNFIGWMFRFGDVIVVGKEGSTREYYIHGIHRPRYASIAINQLSSGSQ